MGSWLENSTQPVLADPSAASRVKTISGAAMIAAGSNRGKINRHRYLLPKPQFHEPLARFFKSSLLGVKLTADPDASIAANRRQIPIGFLHAGFI